MEDRTSNVDWETDLVDLLNELSAVQDEMLTSLTQRCERMVQCDVKEMAAMQPQEEQLAQRLDACHRRRKKLLDQAAAEGLPSDSIQKLASALSEPECDKIGKQVHEASARTRLLRHHSLTNWVLAQRTLLHLSQLLEIIATGGRLQPTYGEGESAHSRGSLVDRAA